MRANHSTIMMPIIKNCTDKKKSILNHSERNNLIMRLLNFVIQSYDFMCEKYTVFWEFFFHVILSWDQTNKRTSDKSNWSEKKTNDPFYGFEAHVRYFGQNLKFYKFIIELKLKLAFENWPQCKIHKTWF